LSTLFSALAPRQYSIRLRIALLATALFAVAMVAVSVAVVLIQRALLIDRIDDATAARATDIGVMLQSGQSPSLASRRDEEAFVQIVDSAGGVVAASENVAGQPPASLESVPPGELRLAQSHDAVPGEEGAYRVAVHTVLVDGDAVTILVGDSLEPVSEGSQALIAALAMGVPALTAVVGAASWFLAARALRPVDEMRAKVDEIGGEVAGRRVPEPGSKDEVARLAGTMNRMLERVDSVQQRQKQFVSDASHELRTPLTAVRASLEVALSSGLDGEPLGLVRSSLTEVGRMERLIEDLLADAVESNASLRSITDVDLDDLVLEEVGALRQTSAPVIDASGVSGAQARGNREQLRRAVRNLLSNAVRYGSSTVLVSLQETGGKVRLAVADDGPGIPADRREAVFERFTRLDEARSRKAGGAGLGLAITRRIVEAHGGRVFVDPEFTGGARLVVELPGRPETGSG
jgi:signal transduction histidine kinase